MRYFYIVWTCCHVGGQMGNNMIRQEGEGPGLDITSAHIWLLKTIREPCIITAWQEVSALQYDRFVAFVSELAAREQLGIPPKPPGVVLQLHTGGKEDEASNSSVERETGKREDDDGGPPSGPRGT